MQLAFLLRGASGERSASTLQTGVLVILRLRTPSTLAAFGLLAFSLGCSASVPTPASGPLPKNEMVLVPYPPPPARVESLPKQAKLGDVWIDGQWDWDGKDWRWQEGRWMTPPANAYFTPWATELRKDGRLYFTPAAWRSADGKRLDVYPTLAACVRDDVAQSQ